uniref:DENN domain-containing protein 1B-like n=1 Tax=Callorhinchus milii TaxID=7868 RepID=A0A4W3GZ64_CALMI
MKLRKQSGTTGEGVARAFLRAQAALFGGYQDALRFNPDEPITFCEETFINHRSSSMRQFLQNAVHLQLFKQVRDTFPHTRSHPHPVTPTHTRSHSLTLVHTRSHPLTPTPILTHIHTHSHPHSITVPHTCSRSLTPTHAHSHSLTPAPHSHLSLSL